MLCKIRLRLLSILFTTTAIFFLFAQFKDDDKKRGAKQIVFFEEKFEDTSFASRGWYDNTTVSLSSTEHISASANSGEYHWKKGDTKPVNGGALRKKFPETDEVYISFWIKYSTDFTGSNKPYHPHEKVLRVLTLAEVYLCHSSLIEVGKKLSGASLRNSMMRLFPSALAFCKRFTV